MTRGPILERLRRLAFLVLLATIHVLAARNVYHLGRDMIRGDGSGSELIPQPLYGFYRIRASDLADRHSATGRLGVDFAQVYFSFPRQYPLRDAFDRATTHDPVGRASLIAPLVHVLCHESICGLRYGVASVWHIVIQGAIFLFVFIAAGRDLGIGKQLPAAYLFVIFCLFVTPAGLSWFERGQFSLYVGASYLTLIWGLFRRRLYLVLISALLAFLKWTALPFAFVVLAVDLLRSTSKSERRFTVGAALVFAGVFIVFSVSYWPESTVFLRPVMEQERSGVPKGLSLAIFLPRIIVKAIPLGLIVLGWISVERLGADRAGLIPFQTGAAILLLLYPTVAYEYSLPVILGLLPLMLLWTRVTVRWGVAILFSLLAFLARASFSTAGFEPKPRMEALYVLTSLLLMISPLAVEAWASRSQAAAASGAGKVEGS